MSEIEIMPVIQRSLVFLVFVSVAVGNGSAAQHAETRSDGDARYLHHIDLYDTGNRKITAQSTLPYSPRNTCGRCHDYNTISHGWHFNAFDSDARSGRDGEPWIWTDARTGTQLPLTYRDWSHSFHPSEASLSPWEMTLKFGGRIPGGGVGEASLNSKSEDSKPEDSESEDKDLDTEKDPPRWPLTGSLEIDCLACHAVAGAYDMNERRSQIEKQNFAWAPTAALRLGEIKGDVSRIRGKVDPEDESVQKKMPTVTYDARNFALDGTVFVDLVRQPLSNACYQCHSQRIVDDQGVEERWIHDEDVHLRAGMDCVDCHRNGLDHDMVRGFEGQQHSEPDAMVTLSCVGCHLGDDESGDTTLRAGRLRAGRMGSPEPLHHGLPPLHFEKLACTACHSGPVIRDEAVRMMTSLAHGLGEKGHRDGNELPAMVAGVFTKRDDNRVHPHKAMWPAYWGLVGDDRSITPLNPEQVYQWTRKTLRVRRDFVDELLLPKLKSSQRKEVLGEERASVDSEQWTDQEREQITNRQQELGQEAFHEKVSASLAAIEKENDGKTAVYVSGGRVYAGDKEGAALRELESFDDKYTGMITWPMAHNVRPAGWSLGIGGCVECHSDEGLIFASTVSAVGPVNPSVDPLGDGEGDVVTMASLQGVDPLQRLAWNQMFSGRKSFKVFVALSIVVLACVLIVGLGMLSMQLLGRTGLANTDAASLSQEEQQ